MTRLAVHRSRRPASCCNVDVMNGAAGRRVLGRWSTALTVNGCPARARSGWLRRLVQQQNIGAGQGARVIEVLAPAMAAVHLARRAAKGPGVNDPRMS